MLVEHMSKGFSFEAFAKILKVCDDTLYEWVKKHPEFADAKRRATAESRYYWEKHGIDGLYAITTRDGDSVQTIKMDSTVWRLNMMNRFPRQWRERHEIAVDSTDQKDAEEQKQQIAELSRQLRELKGLE